MGDQNVSTGPRDGWLTDEQMAEVRGKSLRAQREERLKGVGPPWSRDGRSVLYNVVGYQRWLASHERQPVREPEPSRPSRKRVLETA